jgi:hypothetical protein
MKLKTNKIKKAVENDILVIFTLAKLIIEKRKLGLDDLKIYNELKEKDYSEKFIALAFKEAGKQNPDNQLNINKEVNMVTKKKYDDDEDFEDEDFEENESEGVGEVPLVNKDNPKPKQNPLLEKEAKENLGPTFEDVLISFEQRLQNLEASLYRLRTTI